MIAVIFEVNPKADAGREGYLQLAAALADELRGIDGFLSIERFESLAQPGKPLSLSFWRDEAAINEWRNRGRHRAAQEEGRNRLFESYRLRIAHVERDYDGQHRAEAPADSRERHG